MVPGRSEGTEGGGGSRCRGPGPGLWLRRGSQSGRHLQLCVLLLGVGRGGGPNEVQTGEFVPDGVKNTHTHRSGKHWLY